MHFTKSNSVLFSVINTRFPFVEFMQRPDIVTLEPWFGFEEEYWITDRDGIPLGWELNKDFVDNSKTLQCSTYEILYFILYRNICKLYVEIFKPTQFNLITLNILCIKIMIIIIISDLGPDVQN